MVLEYRRARLKDFAQIVELQNKNLVTVLKPSEQADGFLSAAFSAQDYQAMDSNGGVFVCADAEKVIAYACASSVEHNSNIPLVISMLERLPTIIYKNKPLSTYQSLIYGPVCIDKDYRGKNILAGLFDSMLKFLKNEHPEIELITVLIAKENPRSIFAHQKLGMESVGEFEFNGNLFLIFIFPLKNTTFY